MSLIGQVGELMGELMKRTPWGEIKLQPLIDDITNVASEFIRFLQNGGRVTVGPNPILNFDTAPFIPSGWEVRQSDQIKSRVKGMWEVLVSKIALHFDPGQQGGKAIQGHNLKKKLEGQPVLPAHVLDYLLAHPELIPESWKGKAIFFWGTIYRNADGDLYVRFLYWFGDRWAWGSYWLGSDWGGNNPCAVSAS